MLPPFQTQKLIYAPRIHACSGNGCMEWYTARWAFGTSDTTQQLQANTRGPLRLCQGQYTRRTPLGFDRHWNRYWLLGGTDDGGSPKLYVERTTPVWHGEVGPP